jgi:lysophospholipase L1-like esterase
LQNIYRSNLDSNFNLVSILIGVNNQFRKMDTTLYKTQLIEIIEQAIIYAGNNSNNVIALSIPDYWYTPFGQNYPDKTSVEIDWYNTYKKQICAKYKIKFYNITPITQKGLDEPDLVAKDNLHPSAKMFALWVKEFYKDVLQILSE